jgi:sterol desaturase/sphingolipid hydroxylase (fatty acid hydroxylase superfamily)
MGLGLFVATIFGLSFLLGNFSVVTLVVTWVAFSQINLHNHTLWETDQFPFKYMSFLSKMHHNHHARFTGGNFATITLLYDWLFGTIDYGKGWKRPEAKQKTPTAA